MPLPSRRPLLLILALTATACSDSARLRNDAERRLPAEGPVVAARAHESAAVADTQAVPRAHELPEPLTYDACIAWALEYNRDLRQQISSAERARLGIAVARSQVYAPVLTASTARSLDRTDPGGTSRTDTVGTQLDIATSAFGFTLAPYAKETWSQADGTTASPYTGEVGITLSRRLLALHEWAHQRAPLTDADRGYAQGVNALVLKVRQLAADAVRSFLGLQQAEARMRLRESRAEQAKAFLASVREAVSAGLKAPIEETNALIDYNQAQADLLSDRTAVADSRDSLLSMLDRPLGGTVMIAPLAIDDARPELPPMEQDIAAVLDRHEDLANLRIDFDRAEDAVRFQADDTRPDLTGEVSALRRWTGPAPGDPTASEDILALTLTLKMPLDGWSGDSAKLAQLERQARELRLRIRSKQSDLEQQVRTLRRRIDRLFTGVDLAKQRQAAETDKFKATQASYDAGRVDNLELTRARQSLDQAEVDLLQSRIDLLLALSDRRVLVPPAPAAGPAP